MQKSKGNVKWKHHYPHFALPYNHAFTFHLFEMTISAKKVYVSNVRGLSFLKITGLDKTIILYSFKSIKKSLSYHSFFTCKLKVKYLK